MHEQAITSMRMRGAERRNVPSNGVRYALRQNAKAGELAVAWPFCDFEVQEGTEEDIR
jgi:hypothetical protein